MLADVRTLPRQIAIARGNADVFEGCRHRVVPASEVAVRAADSEDFHNLVVACPNRAPLSGAAFGGTSSASEFQGGFFAGRER